MSEKFFETQTRSSRIKANIVSEYFPKYCNIILKSPQEKIWYVDLFAGPGIYKDGNFSTPLLVAQACMKDPALKNVVKLIFNDMNYAATLKENFERHVPHGTFRYKPEFRSLKVGEDEKLSNYLSTITDKELKNPHPTLLFIDPFGYKGIDTALLSRFLQNWGNEIFLFLNIKRVHAAVENDKFDELMLTLFPSNFDKIKRDRKYKLSVQDRLHLIIENLADEYRQAVGSSLFYTAFKFQEEDSQATSHYILHFTKHKKGYELVKQIYHEFDNIGAVLEKDGTYAFDAKKLEMKESSLFDPAIGNLEALGSILKQAYKEKEITAAKLFDEHQSKTKYSRKHYVEALRMLFFKQEIESRFTDNVEHKVSVLISEHCIIKFK